MFLVAMPTYSTLSFLDNKLENNHYSRLRRTYIVIVIVIVKGNLRKQDHSECCCDDTLVRWIVVESYDAHANCVTPPNSSPPNRPSMRNNHDV